MAPLTKQTARSTTPAGKESNKEGMKSPDKSRPSSSSKAPLKPSLQSKRPLTTPRAPSFTATRERAKPSGSPLAPAERKTPREGKGLSPSAHVRTTSKPLVKRPESRLRDAQASDGTLTGHEVAKTESVSNDEVSCSPAARNQDKVQALEEDDWRKDEEIAELKSQLEHARSENEAQQTIQADYSEQQRAKTEEMGRLADYVHELENNMHSLQRKKDAEIEEVNRRHQQELETVKSESEKALKININENASLTEPNQKHAEEMELLKRTHDHELMNADTRHAQQLKKAVQQYKQQLEDALNEQQHLREAAHMHEIDSAALKSERECEKEEAATINKQQLDEAERAQQQLRDDHQQNLQGSISEYESKLNDAYVAHRKDFDASIEQHRRELGEVKEKHEDRFRQAISDHEKSLIDAKKVQEELEDAAQIQDQRSQETLDKHEKETNQRLENLQHLRDAALEQVQELKDAVTRLQNEKVEMTVEYGQNMKEASVKHEAVIEKESSQKQNEINELRRHIQESTQETVAVKTMLEQLKSDQNLADEDFSQKHKEVLEQIRSKHEQEVHQLREEKSATLTEKKRISDILESITSEHDNVKKAMISERNAEIEDMKGTHAQELERLDLETKTAIEEVNSLRDQYRICEQELTDVRNKKAYAGVEVTKLKAAIADINAKYSASEKMALEQHEKELQDQALTHSKEMGELSVEIDELKTKHSEEAEMEISRLTQELQGQISAHQRETESLGSEKTALLGEVSTLRNEMKELHADNSKERSLLSTQHRQELQSLISKHEQELEGLRDEHKATFNELSQLRAQLMTSDANHRKAVSGHQQIAETVATHHEQELADLRSQHEIACEEATAFKAALQKADLEASKTMDDRARIHEQDLDIMRDERDATIKDHAAKEALNLDLEAGRAALSEEVAGLRTALDSRSQEYENMINKHEDALRDMLSFQRRAEALEEEHQTAMKEASTKLEKDLQQQRIEHMDVIEQMNLGQQTHDQELQMLRGECEAARKQCESGENALTTLTQERDAALAELIPVHEELNRLKSQRVDANHDLHTDLRRYMSVLGRQYSTDVDELAALRADMTRDSGKRKEEWRRGEEKRAALNEELARTIAGFA